MPGVRVKLPACFDSGFFFYCSGVVGGKATAGVFSFEKVKKLIPM